MHVESDPLAGDVALLAPSAAATHTTKRRFATVVVVLLITVGMAPSAKAVLAPQALPSATAAPRNDGTALVTWQFPADSARTQFEISTWDKTSGFAAGFGTRFVNPGTSAAIVDGLLPGRSYFFTISSIGGSSSATASTPVVGMSKGACTWGVCAIVDANTPMGTAQRSAQGFLHSVTSQTPPALLSPLQTTSWRIAPFDTARYAAARAAGGTITMVLSDSWFINNWTGTRAIRNPWQDWNAYTNSVKWTVQWQQNNGMAPDYWDIQNEPDAPNLYAETLPPTRALVLQQFQVAYAAIKQVAPNAKIVGPSLSNAATNDPNQLTDLQSLLSDAAAHNMRYDAISWHENSYGPLGSFEAGPRAIAEHAAWVRKVLSDNPALGSPPFFINEYGAQYAQGNPASEVGYINALERIGAPSATHSCFPSLNLTVNPCNDPHGLLDGLVTTDGQPTSAWWVHRDYAAMRGTKIFADGNAPQAPVYATKAATGEIDALVGNENGCNPIIDSTYCPLGTLVGISISPTLAVTTPTGGPARYAVTIEKLPYRTGALAAPIAVSSNSIVTVSGGAVTVALPTLAVGDAVFVKLIPTTATAAAPTRYR